MEMLKTFLIFPDKKSKEKLKNVICTITTRMEVEECLNSIYKIHNKFTSSIVLIPNKDNKRR